MGNIGTKFIVAERFTFDPLSNALIDKDNDQELIRLGSNESRILWLLAQRPNDVVSRHDLHAFVWREQGFEVDDSSLTQAISTLRKTLKDSTKLPQYIKTVPKRGYQLIARVEIVEQTIQRDSELLSTEFAETDKMSSEVFEECTAPKISHSQPSTSATPVKTKPDWITRLMFLVAIVMPCLVLLTNPSQANFKPLTTVDGIAVNTPINHPDLSTWLIPIKLCIQKYNQQHTDQLKPLMVIATGGQNNQLTLNYIHSTATSNSNISLRIVANPSDAIKVCE